MDLKKLTEQAARGFAMLSEIHDKVRTIDHWIGKWAETQIRPAQDRPLRVEIRMGELFDHAERHISVEWSPHGLIVTENQKVIVSENSRLLIKHFCRPQR